MTKEKEMKVQTNYTNNEIKPNITWKKEKIKEAGEIKMAPVDG